VYDVDLELSDDQKLITQTIRRFVSDEIVPLERELDPDAYELPHDEHTRLVNKVKAMGFYGLDVPSEYGGPGLDTVTRSLVAEELSQHRAGLYAPCYHVFGAGGGLVQLYAGTEAQKEKYLYPMLRGEKRGFFALTEASGGSDPARAIQTKAAKDGDDWVINGSKIFISSADVADFGLVFARTDVQAGRAGITCFIVDSDTPGFVISRIIHTLRSAEYACELSFTNMRVPDENVLGAVGGGFSLANDILSRTRIPYASASVGVAAASQQMSIDWAQVRETFGEKLASRQAIQWMIVDNEIDIRSSRWLYLYAAQKADRGVPFRFEVAMAKVCCTEAAGRVVDRAIQIHGGYGVSKDLPLERWWRELRIRRIGDGASEIQRIIMARDLLMAG
jgi:acyl-CoA dehydrogenase